MVDDPEQRVILYEEYPEQVKELSSILKDIEITELNGTPMTVN